MLAEIAWPAADGPLACVCGQASFAGSVAAGLVALGYPAERAATGTCGSRGSVSRVAELACTCPGRGTVSAAAPARPC